MHRRPLALALLAGVMLATSARAQTDAGAAGARGFAADDSAARVTTAPRGAFDAIAVREALVPPPAPPTLSALALPAPELGIIGLGSRRAKPITVKERHRGAMPMLSAARARILLRSLTVPGWGQATLGRPRSAAVFALAETGVWATFTAFKIQQQLRRESYERTAQLFAGIDLKGRDEEYRRIVGSYLSSVDYNRFVVFRDAANLYYDDPPRYREYIAAHELRGRDTWSWPSIESILRYRGQRKDSQRAAQRANTALAVAVGNRLVSAIHAARLAGRPVSPHSWNLEVAPIAGVDPTAFRFGVRTRF